MRSVQITLSEPPQACGTTQVLEVWSDGSKHLRFAYLQPHQCGHWLEIGHNQQQPGVILPGYCSFCVYRQPGSLVEDLFLAAQSANQEALDLGIPPLQEDKENPYMHLRGYLYRQPFVQEYARMKQITYEQEWREPDLQEVWLEALGEIERVLQEEITPYFWVGNTSLPDDTKLSSLYSAIPHENSITPQALAYRYYIRYMRDLLPREYPSEPQIAIYAWKSAGSFDLVLWIAETARKKGLNFLWANKDTTRLVCTELLRRPLSWEGCLGTCVGESNTSFYVSRAFLCVFL